jgi:restriction system protein
MALWLVRAGRNGEQEDLALDEGLAVIGWGQIPDLAGTGSSAELKTMYTELNPDQSVNKIANQVSQIWAFGKRVNEGDLVALPLKRQGVVAFGEVMGPYRHRPDFPEGAKHTRPVRWIRTDVPRSTLDEDILNSLGSLLTVCQIRRNNIEERIRAMLDGRHPPSVAPLPEPVNKEDEGVTDVVAPLDVEQYARDQIRNFIGRRFRGHELARLVTVLLEAQGYQTRMSPPGADGGVDIVAGRGPFGFDPPRLCVQVKSSTYQANVNVVRELQGVIRHFGADQGLFVSWGGFNWVVEREVRNRFFEMRLWDGGDLVEHVLENYDRLPDDVQAELPLKRIWTLVPEE